VRVRVKLDLSLLFQLKELKKTDCCSGMCWRWWESIEI